MKKVVLKVAERVILMGLLPGGGDYLTYKIVHELKENVGFSEEDIKKFNIRQDNELLLWDRDKEDDKEIEYGEKAEEIIREALKKLDEDKKINEKNISLYEKFMEIK